MLKFILLALLGYLVTFFFRPQNSVDFWLWATRSHKRSTWGWKNDTKTRIQNGDDLEIVVEFWEYHIYIYWHIHIYIYIYIWVDHHDFYQAKATSVPAVAATTPAPQDRWVLGHAPITRSEFWEFLLFLGFFDYVKSCGYCFSGFVSVLPIPQHGICFFCGGLKKVQEF